MPWPERVDRVGGVADQGEARLNDGFDAHQAQRKAAAGVTSRACRGGSRRLRRPARRGFGGSDELVGEGVGGRPDHRHVLVGQRQVGQHAILAEPLEGGVAVGLLAAEVGDHALFVVGRVAGADAGLAYPRVAAVGGDDQRASRRRPSARVRRRRVVDGEGGGAAGQIRVTLCWRLTVSHSSCCIRLDSTIQASSRRPQS
jgi:hypothetical protein